MSKEKPQSTCFDKKVHCGDQHLDLPSQNHYCFTFTYVFEGVLLKVIRSDG